jgi:ABC-2 type transport system ATP-binding protein
MIRLTSSLLIASALLAVAACGGSPSHNSNTASRAPGEAIPPPAPGETRDGLAYRVAIPAADPSFDIVFQILEPQVFSGDQSYPLIMHSHGFGNARAPSHDFSEEVGNLDRLTANGYGALSIDMRAHGESGGQIRVHDPEAEIQDVLLILDWAEENLPWVTTHFDTKAGAVNQLIGAVGASYGGQWQLLTHALDPKKRIDAIVPSNTWSDLSDALNTNGVLKSGWVGLLFGGGNNAGDRMNNFDPYVTELLATSAAANEMPEHGVEFLRYHSIDYFCDGGPAVSTNGGPGTSPLSPPVPPLGIPALFTQGMRDSLFTFNHALNSFNCMRDVGGSDVRLMTYQSGHNTIFPGPGVIYQSPQPTAADRNCAALTLDDATHAFFDEHLLGIPGRLNAVMGPADDICLSLDVNNGVVVDINELIIGGTPFSFGDTQVVAGTITPTTVATGEYTAPAEGAVIAGIPTAEITVNSLSGLDADTIVFVGIGHNRASGNGQGVWDTVEDFVIPLRGTGTHIVELSAVAELLQPGDQIAVNLHGSYSTHAASFSRDPLGVVAVVSGTVNIPIMPSNTVVLSK